VRSYLLFSSMDVQRAYLYFFNDEDEAKLHGASGITRHWVPKPAYYAMEQLYEILGDYRFSRIVKQDKDDLYIFEYTNPDRPKEPIWVVWSPTGTQRQIVKQVQLPGPMDHIEFMHLAAPTIDSSSIHMTRDYLAWLPVSESPLYIRLKLP